MECHVCISVQEVGLTLLLWMTSYVMSEPAHYVYSDWLTRDYSLYSLVLRIHSGEQI